MTMILPSNVYKDFKSNPYLAPTPPDDPIRKNMTEEQQKMLAELEAQRAALESQLTKLENKLADLGRWHQNGIDGKSFKTMISVLQHVISSMSWTIEKIKVDANLNASAA